MEDESGARPREIEGSLVMDGLGLQMKTISVKEFTLNQRNQFCIFSTFFADPCEMSLDLNGAFAPCMMVMADFVCAKTLLSSNPEF